MRPTGDSPTHGGTERHAPGTSGFWIHPVKGTYPLDCRDHHRDLFLNRPDLFGTDLLSAYEDGWVSIRKWAGPDEGWLVVCSRYEIALPLLAAWAALLLVGRPEEAETPVRVTCMGGPAAPLPMTMRQLAAAAGETPISMY